MCVGTWVTVVVKVRVALLVTEKQREKMLLRLNNVGGVLPARNSETGHTTGGGGESWYSCVCGSDRCR